MISKKSHQKQKRRDLIPIFVFILLFPYIVGFISDSTNTYTEFLAGAGGGQYVYHDCSGAHTRNFTDAGIYIGKKFESPFRIGLSVGGWSDKENPVGVFPDLAFDWKQFSIGTTGVRFGDRNAFYLEGKWLDQPPFLSGRGFLRAGIGGKFTTSDTRIWFGTNVFPYNNLGLAAQIEFPFSENKYLYVSGRYGNDSKSSFNEYGMSIGMRIISF